MAVCIQDAGQKWHQAFFVKTHSDLVGTTALSLCCEPYQILK